jgi:hypothetical protein
MSLGVRAGSKGQPEPEEEVLRPKWQLDLLCFGSAHIK